MCVCVCAWLYLVGDAMGDIVGIPACTCALGVQVCCSCLGLAKINCAVLP